MNDTIKMGILIAISIVLYVRWNIPPPSKPVPITGATLGPEDRVPAYLTYNRIPIPPKAALPGLVANGWNSPALVM